MENNLVLIVVGVLVLMFFFCSKNNEGMETVSKKSCKYAYNPRLFQPNINEQVIDDNFIVSQFARGGIPENPDTSTYSVNTKLNSAFINIDKDLNNNFLGIEWEIIKIKNGALVLSSSKPPRLLEFEKL